LNRLEEEKAHSTIQEDLRIGQKSDCKIMLKLPRLVVQRKQDASPTELEGESNALLNDRTLAGSKAAIRLKAMTPRMMPSRS
jgi:hypothetical protein